MTAARNDDGGATVHVGDGDEPNTMAIMEGWNYAVRRHPPRPEILDGSWSFPTLTG